MSVSVLIFKIIYYKMSSRSAKNASYYARTQATRLLKEAIKNVILGRVPNEATRTRYAWKEREINKIRTLDSSFRMVLEDKHGVNLEELYKNKVAKQPIRIANVQVVKEAVARPHIDYPQGLEETLAKGFNTPIS